MEGVEACHCMPVSYACDLSVDLSLALSTPWSFTYGIAYALSYLQDLKHIYTP